MPCSLTDCVKEGNTLMGVCASYAMKTEDREHEKTTTFVRYATSSDLPNLQKMIKNKMDVNARDVRSSYAGKVECVEELLKAGALPNATDANGRNALHHACRKDHDEIHEVDIANRVESAELSARSEMSEDPKQQDDTVNKPLDSATLTLDMSVPTRRRSSVEHTAIRRFGSRRSPGDQYSDQTTEQQGQGQWVSAVVAPTLESSSSLPVSSPVTLYASPPVSPTMNTARRKNLRYAGKRVIMALRVKKALPDEEKIHMIRLLILKYTTASAPALFIIAAGQQSD
ncbi:hypothetical protein BBJ28_00015551 [Nothophytophthora sp. Chile5]|nr:hypothetical protein BBJ28_00015551 [Nothophytophthora sp. Chile5]